MTAEVVSRPQEQELLGEMARPPRTRRLNRLEQSNLANDLARLGLGRSGRLRDGRHAVTLRLVRRARLPPQLSRL